MHPGIKALIACCGISSTAMALAEPPPQRQHELIYLLQQDCGSCHGMTLKGGLGPALLPANLAGKDERFLIDTVMEGRPNTAMPPWKGELSRDEVSWLVQQLKKGIKHAE